MNRARRKHAPPGPRKHRAPQASPEKPAGMVRLQKFLSDAGVASRRDAETMITDGRVSVNDEVVTRLPVFVDPQSDRVVVDGSLARPQALEYLILNKPAGVAVHAI